MLILFVRELTACSRARLLAERRLQVAEHEALLGPVDRPISRWRRSAQIVAVDPGILEPKVKKRTRLHLTLKNRILLENYYLPGEIEARIEAIVDHYNHLRYHESIDNMTPADVYFGRGQTILLEEKGSNAKPSNTDACFTKLMQPKIKPDVPESPLGQDASRLKISHDGLSSCDPIAGQRKRMNAW